MTSGGVGQDGSRPPEGQSPRGGIEIRTGPFNWGMLEDGWVYLLMDCSGSMAGDKLQQAKDGAMRFAKDAVAKGYSVGLIEFYGIANHLCEPTMDLSILQAHIDGLKAKKAGPVQAFVGAFRRGIYGTNIAQAISIARDKLNERKGIKAIVLITDGQANGPGDPEASLAIGEKAKTESIDIITIGTDDADQSFLKKLASRAELGMKVSRDHLEDTIASSARWLTGGRAES
jgi:Mg-chelatase subunit ChlD